MARPGVSKACLMQPWKTLSAVHADLLGLANYLPVDALTQAARVTDDL